MSKYILSAFTKPWKNESVEELGEKMHNLGFEGIEFPLREGYQLEPKDAEKGLKTLSDRFAVNGIKITSVASDTTENVFAGCAEAGIPLIRIMATNTADKNFREMIYEKKKELEQVQKLCEKYNVQVGIQNHYGYGTFHCSDLYELIRDFDPKYIGAVWDAAHSGLSGEEPEQGFDTLGEYLCLVNMKNAMYRPATGPEQEKTVWERYFTTGSKGLADWERIVGIIKNRGYEGVICMPLEYTDEAKVEELAKIDIAYLKKLLG